MSRKRIVFVGALVAFVLAILGGGLFGLSYTNDSYACYTFKSIGRSDAVRVLGFAVWKDDVRLVRSLTSAQCGHKWRWYFANSRGILLNREDWDGPVGNYPFAQEFDARTAENKLAQDGG